MESSKSLNGKQHEATKLEKPFSNILASIPGMSQNQFDPKMGRTFIPPNGRLYLQYLSLGCDRFC
jgi:hypothetical protein